MAEMRLWNGSEFQLLRFLGRHRIELEREIQKNTNINPDLEYKMEWVDFLYAKNSTVDVELSGLDFLCNNKSIDTDKLAEKWGNYWPKTGHPQNWDAVINCIPISPNSKKFDKWVIVEAKAHLGELESLSKARMEGREIIAKAFEKTQERFGIKTKNNWLDKYYQLANRLAFINFMLSNNIEVSLLNIYFIDGWPDDIGINVSSREIWEEKIKEEYTYLGINETAKKYISEIFIKCKGQ